MRDLHPIADRFEFEALRGEFTEFTDAVMRRDYDRVASLFTRDGGLRMPHIGAEASSPEEMRAAVERLQGMGEFFVRCIDITPRAGSAPHGAGGPQ